LKSDKKGYLEKDTTEYIEKDKHDTLSMIEK